MLGSREELGEWNEEDELLTLFLSFFVFSLWYWPLCICMHMVNCRVCKKLFQKGMVNL